MNKLGVDVLSEIFSYLSIRDCLRFVLVSKTWERSFKKGLWKRSINLSFTEVTDEGLKWLQGVHTIDLRWIKVTDEGLKWLQGVHTIDLRYNTKVTDEGMKWLQGVHTINLFNTKVTDEGLKWLQGSNFKNYKSK